MSWIAILTSGWKSRQDKRKYPGYRCDVEPSEAPGRAVRLKSRPTCERLEDRNLMTAIAGYDYLLSGESWADPSHISYSIAPDGVFWDHGTNSLNATFNSRFGTDGTWQKQIARALATWQSVANINLVPVGDSTYDFNVLGSSQAD